MKIKKLLCKVFGHKWHYNHVSHPTRCYCERCDIKYKIAYNKPPCHPSEICYWVEVDPKLTNL